MRRKRIHELAKAWGVPPRAIIVQLEKMGSAKKTAQSALSEEETEQVKANLGLLPAPSPQVGKEQLVSERVIIRQAEGAAQGLTTKERVTESRVGSGVIRRRTTRIEVLQEPVATPERKPEKREEGVPELNTPFTVTPPVAFELSPSPEPLPHFEVLAAELPAVALPAGRAGATVPLENIALQAIPASTPHVAVEAPRPAGDADGAAAAGARPSRILGRIDLQKIVPPSQPQRRPEAPRTPVTSGVKEAEKIREAAVVKKQPHKRTVIRTPKVTDPNEREVRLLQTLKKKRALPSVEQKQTELTVPKASKRVVKVAEVITVSDLAKVMGVKASEVIEACA